MVTEIFSCCAKMCFSVSQIQGFLDSAHSLVTLLNMQSQLQMYSAETKISVTSYVWFHLKNEIFAALKMRLSDKLNVVYFEI